MISNVRCCIKGMNRSLPNIFGEDIPIKHKQDGNTITFTLEGYDIMLAQVAGVTVTYDEELT